MDIPYNNVMMLQEFKLSVAEALLLEGKQPHPRKRGRSSAAESVSLLHDKKKKSSPATKMIPRVEVRTDGYFHLSKVGSRGRCKNPGCKAAPEFFCEKYIFALRLRKTAFTNSIPNEHDFTHKKTIA